jgi:hypothetical protein
VYTIWPCLTVYRIASRDAKLLLKSRKSSLRLYNAFAISEYHQGRHETADVVFSTAISKIGSLQDGSDVILLWCTWIWQKLSLNQPHHAIHLLLSLADEHPSAPGPPEKLNSRFFPLSVLKIARHLNDGIARTSSRAHHADMVLYVEVLALFSYFQHGNMLASAIDVFRQNEIPPVIELLHQSRTRLLKYHSQYVKPFKPSEIKQLLSESITLFPGNTTFLEAYWAQENVFGLNDRLRTLVLSREFLNQESSISQWLFAIWSAGKRRPELGATLHGARALFERAVASAR